MLQQFKVYRHNIRFRKLQEQAEATYQHWLEQGKPLPMPHIAKQKIIQAYKDRYGIQTLVETGTYLGDMIAAQLPNFARILSIELSEDLHQRAKIRFRKSPKVELYQGDSGKVLHSIVPQLKGPAIFWLDGHYSAGITAKGDLWTPIYAELDAILQQDVPHVLLIDDAQGFTGENDYPTIEELTNYIKKKAPAYQVQVEDYVIRVTRG
ncbi:hypothetical protein DLD77_00160 [Chitinophaga alhagiae]|uniref:Class I SAM-dependent methyltransferase n=1 Tax=Chitinophaga alhagiae TaxID=2203219 RepID=A0ABM6W8I4_9BACT|nr:hypothetical protein [Chitinophaga alhagiae]AWO00228.1 hypothetical protein DLD77_00160 [Chitinophaga alhagiae]